MSPIREQPPIHESLQPTRPSFIDALLFWLRLGFISFGGPAGQIGIMHDFLVEKKRWISPKRFMHALNYCMLLPGPEAQQLATYIGWLLHGIPGGLVAGLFFILPSIFILLGLSIAYVTYGKIAWVGAIFVGLKPAVIAIICAAVFKIGKRSLEHRASYYLATLSFLAITVIDIPFPFIILTAILVGFLGGDSLISKHGFKEESSESDEKLYFLNSAGPTKMRGRFRFDVAFLGLLLWVSPLLVLSSHPGWEFWRTLSLMFTKAALVTFGGAYSVLPYVSKLAVEKYHWLTHLQMIDGLALGETTPGPLIMVLAFVGFMAAYNHFSYSLLAGISGLLITVYFTFLPSFILIFLGAPFVERAESSPRVKSALSSVTAAVVGVVLSLAVYFGRAVVVSRSGQINYFELFWVVFSLLALYLARVSIGIWVLVSAVVGIAWSYLG